MTTKNRNSPYVLLNPLKIDTKSAPVTRTDNFDQHSHIAFLFLYHIHQNLKNK